MVKLGQRTSSLFSAAVLVLLRKDTTFVSAWGPIPLKGSGSNFGLSSFALYSTASHDDESSRRRDVKRNSYRRRTRRERGTQKRNNYRAVLERTFQLQYDEDDYLDFLVERVHQEDSTKAPQSYTHPSSSVLNMEEFSATEEPVFDETLSSDLRCSGDACDEDEDGDCPIPDEFKILPSELSVDVMNFLGIQRAEPLLKDRFVGEWE